MGRFLNFLVIAVGILCLNAGMSHGIEVHNFDCKNCHKVGVSFTDLGNGETNVCLGCHKDNPPSTLMLDDTTATPTGVFAPTDASNAMASYPSGLTPSAAPGSQSSHMWSASDFNEAAGAQSPSDWRFYGRYGISTGKVTCQRCHDPHARDPENTKILRMWPEGKDAMCIDCHAPWNIDNTDHGLLSHPMVEDYAAVQAANPNKYKSPEQVALAQGEISLVEGKVSCSSCHGVHFSDSDGATVDGPSQILRSGDGKLLKADGPSAADKSILCQACHTYSVHGSGMEAVGCLVCHSGHSYNGGTPNYYVLRNEVETATFGVVAHLAYRDLRSELGGTSTTAALWSGAPGSANGYCERCHGELTTMPGSTRAHYEGEDCNGCHSHNGADNEYAFGANCTDCHGWPPQTTDAGGPDGYAFVSGSRDYSNDTHYKSEDSTAHATHAGAGSAYGMVCGRCHDDNFSTTHNDNDFQNVFTGATADSLASANGVLSPSYDITADGTCSNVYCHSNGGKRNSSGTKILGDYIRKTISWRNQTISSCDACHGNDATDMAPLNSASHIAHLDAGYTCNICHFNTATSASALANGAETGNHVNGAVDVSFDNSYELSAGHALGGGSYGSNGTCAIYCHSDGQGSEATPDWDEAASGTCGTCHGNAPGSGAHARHVSDATGPQLACSACHPANSGNASHSEHVDGKIDVVAGVCNPCHGSVAGQSTAGHPDREPIWTSAGSVDCLTCHTGAEIAAIGGNGGAGTYVDKNTFATLGHGEAGLTGAPSCQGCHDASAAGHFDGNGSDRLLADPDGDSSLVDPATLASAWCQQCHGQKVHFDDAHIGAGTSTDGNECAICHEPHGEGMGTNSDAMLIVGEGFVDKTVASSYFNGTNDGVCQTCHDANAVAHYNRAGSDGHNSGSVCSSCHTHGSDPAFQGGECYDCHGDGAVEYWPQGAGNDRTTDERSDFNNAGRHQRHMEALAAELGYTLPGTDAQQKEMCGYCHTVGDSDHAQLNNGTADVFRSGSKRLWDAGADGDASFSAVDFSCSNLDCHNGKPTTATYNWYTGSSSCVMCHNDIATTAAGTTGSAHQAHVTAGVTYGRTIGCADCHDAATAWGATPPASNHINGSMDVGGTVTLNYTGSYTDFDTRSGGTCGTNACHNRGDGGEPVAAYTWGGALASACGICHAALPATNDHSLHLSGVSGPKLTDDCGSCHKANTNNTSMGGMSTHLNQTISFRNLAAPASPYEITSGTIAQAASDSVDSCDNCHGGHTAANLAKDAWAAGSGVTCGSCHGTYSAATSAADGSGVSAPVRAGTAFGNYGHGKVVDHDLYGGSSCGDCHSSSALHISGSLGDADRLGTVNGQNYANDSTAYCSVCHSFAATVHYANTQTADGVSFDGITCISCHDPHGQNGNQDAMVRSTIDGKVVSGFSDRSVRASYYLETPNDGGSNQYGICQVCHDADEVNYFNWIDDAPAHYPGNCITCHMHDDSDAAFKPSGCYGCHGGGTIGAIEGNFWPDSVDRTIDQGASANDSGAHETHMRVLADRIYGQTCAELLDDASSATKQKALCAYCHVAPGADGDHSAGDHAEVTSFKHIGTGAADGATPAAFNYDYANVATATCSAVDCHNSLTTSADYGWYAGGTSTCIMCHSEDGGNLEAVIDPSSGLHVDQGVADVTAHDGAFGVGGTCTSCHGDPPTASHIDGTADTDVSGFNFDPAIDLKLGTVGDNTDDTCLANCHSDSGNWYRLWSADAFDSTPLALDQPLPARCQVCHGVFGQWAEGTSHAGTSGGVASMVGSRHNGQADTNPGAACEDCHVFPSQEGLHEDGAITLNDSVDAKVDPTQVTLDGQDYVYCQACHNTSLLPPEPTSRVYPASEAFSFVEVDGPRKPDGACFSGESGCHGDMSQNWWPNAEGSDPAHSFNGGINYGYPNRAGAHPEHNLTIGKLIAETRTGNPDAVPTQEDYNNTCQFCHPMTVNASGTLTATYHDDGKTDLYGGFIYTSADRAGANVSGDPASGGWSQYDDGTDGDGYIYQRDNPTNPGELYPIDGDGTYRQYLYSERDNPAVNHGTCSNIACHSNAPFTPQWYGDDQAPGEITDLTAVTHDTRETHVDGETDQPGTVLLTWTAPGDNGQFNGTAYEYEVYYSTAGPISEANLGSATRAGGAPPVQREGTAQEMVVDGLDPGTSYYFAVRTQDEPFYEDNNGDGVHGTFVRDGNTSPLAATASAVAAHSDDVAPIFWGINSAKSHDTGDAVNLSWDAARDHTLPITYRVYWSGYSLKTHLARGGTLPTPGPTAYNGGVESTSYTEDSGGGAPTEGGSDYTIHVSTTHALTYQATGLSSGVLYNFLVCAEDGATTPNVDNNGAVAMALASSLPQEEERTELYLLNGASGMSLQADPSNPDWASVSASSIALLGTSSVTFTAGTDLDGAISRETWLQGISMDIHVTNGDRRLPQSFQVQFGHDNGSGSFTAIGSAVDVGLGRRARRVMKVSLSANKGLIPADANLMIRFTRTTTSGSTSDITLAWGSDANKGQLLINAQPVNHAPSAPVVHALSREPGGYVQVTWDPSNDNDNGNGGQTLHYDIFASCDGGASWPYVLGHDLTDADAVTGVRWDTVGDGLDRFSGGQYNCQVKVEASDGFLFETTPGSDTWLSHTASSPASISLDNRYDDEAPAAVNIHHVETRPKQGTTYLEWIAVGNDGYNHGTRAAYYDIRYRKTADGVLADANWDDAATYQAEGEPVPGFSGYGESFELVGMTPDTEHTLAMKTCDAGEDDVPYTADDNCSPLSNVVTHMSGQYYCGICHFTPPDEPDTRGTHRAHGFTEEDCAKCHGDAVLTYDGRHYDGVINIGWAENSDGSRAPLAELLNASGGSGVSVTQTTDSGDVTIYQDPDGAGGYNAGTAYDPASPLQNTDSGTCLNFGAANARGCHGPFEPKWEDDTTGTKVEPACADCHGSKDMTVYDDITNETGRLTDPYGRQWDEVDTTKPQVGGRYQPTDQVEASPPLDNHNLGGKDTRYTGAHLRHLNASFRFAKGDSCRLCHKGVMESGLHANREVNVVFDVSADQSETVLAEIDDSLIDVDTKGISCSSLNNAFCHDTAARWAEPGAKCNDCHGMAGKAFDPLNDVTEIGHVMGANGDVVPCEYCHVAGHPQSPDGITSGDPDALLINNNAAIGISYRSGGIHLKRAYPWGTYNSLAEICWGCHDQNHDGDLNDAGDINEFGTNQRAATGNSAYHYGTLDQKSWVGAVWSSGYGQTSSDPFYYKRGSIQSTHSTDPSGTSQVTWNSARGRYDETPDPVERIRCSNCHDVHNLNKAPGDTMTGIPYLRGTWMGNPYEEDGAPWAGRTYFEPQDGAIDYTFGAVPRGGTEYDQLGGFYIDQNNALPGTGNNVNPTPDRYPTSGWTLQASAGLCTLCHGINVDTMDQRTPAMDPVEGNLWLGTNGHSNSALGGSFSNGANIFDYSHGRPEPVIYNWGGGRPRDQNHFPILVPDMAFLYQGENVLAGGGYRGQDSNTGRYNPLLTAGQPYAYNGYDWGASVDGTTTDQMYHQFSCSKCHNPHASRLPKLMITNCLDIRHNTWDDNQNAPYLQDDYTASALTDVDRGMPAAYYAAAQNCHRFDGRRSTSGLRGGWNKVTPWTYTNYGTGTEEEHKGGHDPAYNTRSGN